MEEYISAETSLREVDFPSRELSPSCLALALTEAC